MNSGIHFEPIIHPLLEKMKYMPYIGLYNGCFAANRQLTMLIMSMGCEHCFLQIGGEPIFDCSTSYHRADYEYMASQMHLTLIMDRELVHFVIVEKTDGLTESAIPLSSERKFLRNSVNWPS